MPRRIGTLLIRLAFAYLLLQMLINAFRAGGWDFPVYYRTGLHLLNAEPVYDLVRDGNSTFKYPPWIAPFFLPLTLFSQRIASVVWQLLQFASACSIFLWCRKNTRHSLTVPLSAVLFYGIFHVNILAGQIQLPLLGISLTAFDHIQRRPNLGFTSLFLALSTKIFNLFSLAGLPKGSVRGSSVAVAGVLATLLGLPALSGFPGWNPVSALHAYVEVATSKTVNLRGAHQGLPAFFQEAGRLLAVNVPEWDAFTAALLVAIGVLVWVKKRTADPARVFAASLALGAAIHPLAFSYSFLWAFPAAAFAIERAFFVGEEDPERVARRALTLIGLLLLLVIPSGMVTDWGGWVPDFGVRGVGAMCLSLNCSSSLRKRSVSK
jgi:hypothetical protein